MTVPPLFTGNLSVWINATFNGIFAIIDTGSCPFEVDSDYGILWASTLIGETSIQLCGQNQESGEKIISMV